MRPTLWRWFTAGLVVALCGKSVAGGSGGQSAPPKIAEQPVFGAQTMVLALIENVLSSE